MNGELPLKSEAGARGLSQTVEAIGASRLRASPELFLQVVWALVATGVVVGLWQLVVVVANAPEVILPSPMVVAKVIASNFALLWRHTLVTLREILLGYGIAVVVGVLVAVALVSSRVLERIVYPLLIMTQAVPKVAIAPLFLIWFGYGLKPNVLMAAVVAVFPIIINTALGLAEINPNYLRLGRVMGSNSWRLFWRIRFPEALPSILAGLKLAITFATIGAVVGELIAGQEGLGYLTQFASGQLNTPLTFAALVVLSVLGVVLFYAVWALERAVIRSNVSPK